MAAPWRINPAFLEEFERAKANRTGLETLEMVIDRFIKENIPLIWQTLYINTREGQTNLLLLKLIDKAMPTPQTVRIRAEGFKLEVVHVIKPPEEEAQEIEGVEVQAIEERKSDDVLQEKTDSD